MTGITVEDFEKAGSGDFVAPQPGIYTGKLVECNPGFSKDDSGKEDKKKPRLECIYEIIGEGRDGEPSDTNYSRLWEYISFGESTRWKRASFLLSMGLSDGTKNFDGTVDTEEIIGTKVIIRVKADKDLDGNYRAKIGSTFPFKDEDEAAAFGDEGPGDAPASEDEDDESPF